MLVLDLPIEKAAEFRDSMAGVGVDTIFLLSPTTVSARIRKAGTMGRGFLYGISRLGVTRALSSQKALASWPSEFVERPPFLPRWASAFHGRSTSSRLAAAGASAVLVPRVESYVGWLKGERGAHFV